MVQDSGGPGAGGEQAAGTAERPARRPALLPLPADPPSAGNGYYRQHARLLADSFRRCTGRELIAPAMAVAADGEDALADDIGLRLFEAPFAVLSHGEGTDPCFTYGNRTALALFEADWATLLAMPSRLSAEPIEQAERARLLARVRAHGFIDDYSGVRISRRGRRFLIRAAVVWTLTGDDGSVRGQAATFADWRPLP